MCSIKADQFIYACRFSFWTSEASHLRVAGVNARRKCSFYQSTNTSAGAQSALLAIAERVVDDDVISNASLLHF